MPDTDAWTDRPVNIWTQTGRQNSGDRQTYKHLDRQTCKHLEMDMSADIWAQADLQTYGHTQTHRHLDTDPQISRHGETLERLHKQTHKHLDRQAHIPLHVDRPMTYRHGQICKHLATGRPTST